MLRFFWLELTKQVCAYRLVYKLAVQKFVRSHHFREQQHFPCPVGIFNICVGWSIGLIIQTFACGSFCLGRPSLHAYRAHVCISRSPSVRAATSLFGRQLLCPGFMHWIAAELHRHRTLHTAMLPGNTNKDHRLHRDVDTGRIIRS